MGRIDTDPASSDLAQTVVKAVRYYTIKDDGLKQPWRGNVWLNPPYVADSVPKFLKKLLGEIKAGRTKQVILLVNNCTETKWFQLAVKHCQAVCFPPRIAFWQPDGSDPTRPIQAQVLVYFGKRPLVFKRHFKQFGWGFINGINVWQHEK
jgi:ParB family chromosome partitioning protein